MSDIKSEDFTEVASALATPVAGEPVAADAPVPTDKYLTPADVEASKTAKPVDAGKPAVDAAGKPVDAAKGEPPKDKWDTILANARAKERAEVEGQYAWAKDLNRDDVEATRKWIELGNQNPLMALDQLVQGMIASQPEHKAAIEHYFKNILQTQGAAAAVAAAASVVGGAVAEDEMPGPDVPTDTSNGQPVVYSAKQMKLYDEWKTRQYKKELAALKTEMQGQISPIISEREETAKQARIDTYVEKSVGAIANLPGYDAFRSDIADVYSKIPLSDPRTEGEKLRDAYLIVMTQKMSEQTEEATKKATDEAIASVHRRAEAGTVNPTAASASQPFDYKKASWQEALRHEFNSQALGR